MALPNRPAPINESEATLGRLCQATFLQPWCHPRLHKDMPGQGGSIVGKEICDLLVVFDRHVIVFSDKRCKTRSTGNVDLDWTRRYRDAVLESAEATFGAERWIREHPDRVFHDAACTQSFGYELPSPHDARFHRIVVARRTSEVVGSRAGAAARLLLLPHVRGKDHVRPVRDGGIPYAIGWVVPGRGYVHVLDDSSLFTVLETLGTVRDFVEYLDRKEELMASGRLRLARGEEELLAHYLTHKGPTGNYDFRVPAGGAALTLRRGGWEAPSASPQRARQLAADGPSHFWDAMIERFARHALGGTVVYKSPHEFPEQERVLRILAAEGRTSRRALTVALLELVKATASDVRAARLIIPRTPAEPYYLFLLYPWTARMNEEVNRRARLAALADYCKVVKVVRPEAQAIVGLATESGPRQESEDLVFLDATTWTDDEQAEALAIQAESGILVQVTTHQRLVLEYPE